MVKKTAKTAAKAESAKCQSCGAEIKADVCMGCMMDPSDCVCTKDVTSSVYPM